MAIGDSGYYKPSGLTGKFEGDARALFKNKEWVNLPNGRRIKMDVINYQGGKTTMFQIDRDPNFHVVYEFGFGRVEQTIPIVHP